ncbi:hypothetical protein Landi51_06009 [Colletotrichum acutatum]
MGIKLATLRILVTFHSASTPSSNKNTIKSTKSLNSIAAHHTATQEQMEAWAPDPVKRDKFIFQFHLDMLEAAREPWRRAQRAHFIRVKDDNAWVYRQLRKNWKNEMAAAQKAAEEGDIRTPTQEDFMEVDRAGSSSQGGNASGK